MLDYEHLKIKTAIAGLMQWQLLCVTLGNTVLVYNHFVVANPGFGCYPKYVRALREV